MNTNDIVLLKPIRPGARPLRCWLQEIRSDGYVLVQFLEGREGHLWVPQDHCTKVVWGGKEVRS